MGMSNNNLVDYAESLYAAESFDEAFNVLEDQVVKLGYEGVLYTYIPRILIDSNFSNEPVYIVSSKYCPKYLEYYTDTRFDKSDPLIKTVQDGVTEAIDWWGEISARYIAGDKASEEVIATSRNYGISNGITLPLMCEEKGIAGASFITPESTCFDALKNENIDRLKLCTNMFHSLVLSNSGYAGRFIKPVLNNLNKTERLFLEGLARGKTPAQLSVELG